MRASVFSNAEASSTATLSPPDRRAIADVPAERVRGPIIIGEFDLDSALVTWLYPFRQIGKVG